MKTVTFDFETYWANDFSLTSIPNFDYITDPRFKAHGMSVKEGDNETYWVDHADLQDWFDSVDLTDVDFISHNSYFDVAVAVWVYGLDIDKVGRFIDTQGMARAITKPLTSSASLNNTSKFLLKDCKIAGALDSTKNIVDLSDEILERLIPYANQDVDLTKRIYDEMLPMMSEKEMELIDLHLRLYFRKMVHLDKETILEIKAEDMAEREGLIDKAKEYWPEFFCDCDTSEEMFKVIRKDNKSVVGEIIKKEGKFPPRKRNKKGKLVVECDKKSLKFMKLCAGDERLSFLRTIVMKAGSNLIQGRMDRMYKMSERFDGWHQPMLIYHGAHTGRSSGGDSVNAQNLPVSIRRALKAPKGKSIVIADSANIEARVLAWFSGQEDILDICRNADAIDRAGGSAKEEGKDIYTSMAKRIGSDDRSLGKVVVLGCGFGMGLNTFLYNAKINQSPFDEKTLERAFYGWREANPKTVVFWDSFYEDFKTTALARKPVVRGNYSFEPFYHGTALVLPSGRKLVYPKVTEQWGNLVGANKQNYWPGALTENVVQAAARDVVFYQALESKEVLDHLWLLIHDELDMVIEDERADYLLSHSVDVLSTPPAWAPDLPVCGAGGIVKSFTKI